MDGASGFGSGLSSGGFGASLRRSSLWQTSATGVQRDECNSPILSEVYKTNTSETEKDRSLILSPTSESQDTPYSTRDFFGSSRNRSPRMSSGRSSSRRSKTGRRKSGRRSDRPGHCFNCGQHGHISKMCPEKALSASADELRITDSGIVGEKGGGSIAGELSSTTDQVVRSGGPIKNEQTSKLGFALKAESEYKMFAISPQCFNISGRDSYLDEEKLETQKARWSYYGFQNDEQLTAKSPEVDKFSEQLDNALKLSPPKTEALHLVDAPPRASEKGTMVGKGGSFPSGARNSPSSMSRGKTPDPKPDKPAEMSNERKGSKFLNI